MPGTLYLVATPIGNLEDITLRGLRILRESDVIACEDTRRTRQLLEHFGIGKRLISFHEHNEASRIEEFLSLLEPDESRIALVSDAGSPLISDPGYRLVAEAAARGVRVEPIPGPSALVAALSAAGLPTDAVFFAGFLPPKAGARRRTFEALRDVPATLVFYEAPHRILETLTEAEAVLGDRKAMIAREMTKLHEEFLRGTVSQLRQDLLTRAAIKGEMTLLIDRTQPATVTTPVQPLDERVQDLIAEGISEMDAIKRVAKERGLSKREVYREIKIAAGAGSGRGR